MSAACSNEVSSTAQNQKNTRQVAAEDVIATVGDEKITYSLLSTMLNSSAMVGLSVPALGTAERNYVIITLLDKAITANLLYLDAMKKGVNKNVVYQRDIAKFKRAILASLYKSKILFGNVVVSDQEKWVFKNSRFSF